MTDYTESSKDTVIPVKQSVIFWGQEDGTTNDRLLVSALENTFSVIRCITQQEVIDACSRHKPAFILSKSPGIEEENIPSFDIKHIPVIVIAASAASVQHQHRSTKTDAANNRLLDWFLVKTSGKLVIIRTTEIDWIEAWGDYVRLHCGEKVHVSRKKISDIEQRLDRRQFLRISKSSIVNIWHVRELSPIFHGDYLVTMQDGTELNLSRSYHKLLDDFFGATL